MLARAADHQHTGLIALVQVLQHIVQLAPKNQIQGVERLGPVEHQVGNMVLDVEVKASQGFHRRLQKSVAGKPVFYAVV
jgi:hypothetical protein